MDRFMTRLKNAGYGPADARQLLGQARQLCQSPDATIRDVRVSPKHVELDISAPASQIGKITDQLAPIGQLIQARHIIEEAVEKIEAVKQGASYFNEHRFWECHEALEGVWKGCQEGERDLVQGLILAAAGLVHHQKNEDAICLSIFRRALEKLEKSAGSYYEINMDAVRSAISHMVKSKDPKPFPI